MEYSKEDLIKYAIRRLETIDDALQHAQEFISAAYAERRVVRHLLFLACEKEEKENILEV